MKWPRIFVKFAKKLLRKAILIHIYMASDGSLVMVNPCMFAFYDLGPNEYRTVLKV